MSAKSDALEAAVTDYIQARTALDAAPRARARTLADRAFARLAALAAPRIRYFSRRYGLADVTEDGGQASAIALPRAAEHSDPARARLPTPAHCKFRRETRRAAWRVSGSLYGWISGGAE